MIYENDCEDIDNLDYRDFYGLFCKFYNKIKIEYFDSDDDEGGYMKPIEYYNDDFDDLISSEDSDTD